MVFTTHDDDEEIDDLLGVPFYVQYERVRDGRRGANDDDYLRIGEQSEIFAWK